MRMDHLQARTLKKLGYLRVSTHEQRPDRQIDGLQSICDALFIEHASAATIKRPVYQEVITQLTSGDGLVVWDLDRAWRSTLDALTEIDRLRQRGIRLEIANLQIDTECPSGMLLYTIMGAFAEFERRILSQRTKEGLAAARARGVRIGRPPRLNSAELKSALDQIKSGKPIKHVAAAFGMAPWSLSRALKRGGHTGRPE